MTMRRIAALTGTVLAGFILVGCATATIEDAVPAGALMQSDVESMSQPVTASPVTASPVMADQQITPASAAYNSTSQPADAYPDLNVRPATAAPQISAQKKAADRAQLQARKMQIAAEGRRNGASQNGETLGALAQERAAEAQSSLTPHDTDALRRLADRHIEETLKEIEGR